MNLEIANLYSGLETRPTLHLVVVGDTMEGESSGGTESSIDQMHRLVVRIAGYTKIKINVAIFEGYQTLRANVTKYLNNMDIRSKDLCILCFFMHGTRSAEKNTKWPDLYFPIDKRGENSVDFSYFSSLIQNKHPKFLLSIADCCNEIVDPIERPLDESDIENEEERNAFVEKILEKGPSKVYALDNMDPHYGDDDEIIEKYRKLFLQATGSILIASSSPGEAAWRDPRLAGGYFTMNLIRALRDDQILRDHKISGISWKVILEAAASKLQKELAVKNRSQTPQFDLNVEHEECLDSFSTNSRP